MRESIRIWLIVVATSTSISLADALVIYGKYGSQTNINEAEAAAALLLIQLIVLAIALAMVGLAKVFGRLPAQEELPKTMLVVLVCAILLKLFWLDARTGRLYDFQEAIPNSIIVSLALCVIALHIIIARRLLKRRDTSASQAILSNEHLVLAVPILMAMVFVSISDTSDRLAFTRWYQPVFIAMGAAFLVIAFFPVEKLRYLLGKSVILTAACIGIVLAPVVSERMHAASLHRMETPAGAPQHVLLVTVDTLRADALSVHEASNNHTPALEEFAKQSVVFENAISPSCWTIPATSSIMTGLYPMTHQVAINNKFDDKLTTIGDIFAAHGYRTGAIVSNPILFPGIFVTEMDFQDYQAFPSKQSPRLSFGLRLLWRLFSERWPADATTTGLTNLAIQWYDRHREGQTFLWLHYLDPHLPYAPPELYLEKLDKGQTAKSARGFSSVLPMNIKNAPKNNAPLALKQRAKELYMAEARYVDHEIGRLLDYLKDKDLFDDMLIVFTSDHGEEFWEHGNSGHGIYLYNEAIHVPFMIKMPEQSHPVMVSERVSTVDILPTVADMCDLSVEDGLWDGRSLEGFFESSGTRPGATPVFSASTMKKPDAWSVISRGYKLISNVEAGKDELYSLDVDPQELHDIAQEYPEMVEELKIILADAQTSAIDRRAQLGLGPMPEHLKLDPSVYKVMSEEDKEKLSEEEVEALNALGYLVAFE